MKGMGIKIKNNKLSDKWYRKIHRILSKMAVADLDPIAEATKAAQKAIDDL